MNILFFLLGFAVVFAIAVIAITKIVNYFRGKKPVDYEYTLEKIKVFLDFSTFKSFYFAVPENFYLKDETVYFNEDGYRC